MAKSNLPYKPSIFKQGLILVLIPLSVGTCVLLFLQQLFVSTEYLARQERRQNTILEVLNETLKIWALMSSTQFGVAVEKNATYEETINRSSQGLSYKFYQLKHLCADKPKQLKTIQRLESIFQQEFYAVSALPRSGEAGMDMSTVRTLPKTLSKIYKLRTELKQILNREWKDLQEMREKQRQARQVMKLVAYGCIAGNIILALVLVWLYARSISNRMKILIESAGSLPRQEIPSQHLSGNDELSYLDKVLTQTAERLQEAAAHRQSILGMVAHDMRSPLMASQTSIQMIEELGGDFVEEAFLKLEFAHDHLSQILKYVEQLLKVQKAKSETKESVDEATVIPGAEKGTLATAEAERRVLNALPPASLTAGQTIPGMLLEFFFRPKLFHQGLLLVMGPLLLQTGYLLFVNHQLLSTETISAGEERCADINIVSNLISMDMVQGAVAKGIFLITSSEAAEKLAVKNFDELHQNYVRLAELAGKDRAWQDYIELARKAAQHQIDRFMSMQAGGSPSEIFAQFTEIGELKERTPEAFHARQVGAVLISDNLENLHKTASEQSKLANLTSNVFGIAIGANFLLALLMLYLYSSNTTRRLNILVDNASLIGGRQNLQKALAGTDEIAYLDLILHQSKVQLDVASEQRALMMSSLANDMRAPLRLAQGELERFASVTEKAQSEQTKKHLNRSQSSIGRVLKLVDDLLSMESLQAGSVDLELSSCNIRNIADDALATVSSLAKKKNINLLNQCKDASLTADKARLIQVLINYLSNAIKFSPENTSITVTSEDTGSCLKVSVIDQGPGMDKETRDRVFEKFFQANTEQKKQGFGLGLDICQMLVQSHGGKLGVDSEIGKGSSFWFEVPKERAAK